MCKNCGCVLGDAEEHVDPLPEKTISVNLMLLGSAMAGRQKSPQQCFEENTLRFLELFVKKYGLPVSFATETFTQMKKKKRGFQSENNNVAIKTLIGILSKDDNYLFIHKLRMIKSDYEKSFSG